MAFQNVEIKQLVTFKKMESVVAECWEKERLNWIGFVPSLNKESKEYREIMYLFHPSFFGLYQKQDVETIETMDTSSFRTGEPYYFNDEDDLLSLSGIRGNLYYHRIFFEEFWEKKHWSDRIHLSAVESLLGYIKRSARV